MKFKIIIGIVILLSLSCSQNKPVVVKPYDYGTKNDSALYYFNKGWEYIMDYGQWTLSEQAFRKAVSFDATFMVGKSLVGKITQDLKEREKLLAELNRTKNLATKDNQLLLEITLNTMALFNARDQNKHLSPEFIKEFRKIGEENYCKFVHKYPEEDYMKAEYIEFLHANQGAEVALDSLNFLTSPRQKEVPFFMSYAAILEAELKNYEKALMLADRLSQKVNDSNIPEPYALYAKIYAKMDSIQLAKSYIDQALALDSNHVIATRLQKSINNKLGSEN